jgi:raffinose/stachyose/melibiose transport system permease protein
MPLRSAVTHAAAIIVCVVVFIVPFAFIVLTAMKDDRQASQFDFAWPTVWQPWQNLVAVITARDYQIVLAFWNSILLTVFTVVIVVILAAMTAFVLQRRPGRINGIANFLILMGLIIPPAIVPTIWVLQGLGIYRTLFSLILIEVVFNFAFCVLLFRSFLSTVPRELDEAASLDGAGPLRLFFRIVFPVLRPVAVTAMIVTSVAVFNDFANPLYFLPGEGNATAQLTLFNFQSQYSTQWNLLAMDILLITIPPLIAFLIFNRQIVAGMAAGAVK